MCDADTHACCAHPTVCWVLDAWWLWTTCAEPLGGRHPLRMVSSRRSPVSDGCGVHACVAACGRARRSGSLHQCSALMLSLVTSTLRRLGFGARIRSSRSRSCSDAGPCHAAAASPRTIQGPARLLLTCVHATCDAVLCNYCMQQPPILSSSFHADDVMMQGSGPGNINRRSAENASIINAWCVPQ